MTILGAFNWIVIDATCPACARNTRIRCQTHVASSYSGDARGRFHDREYRLGETMPWFAPEDARYDAPGDPSTGEEACYAECEDCHAELCVVIRFRAFVPEAVVHVSREDDWPDGHPR